MSTEFAIVAANGVPSRSSDRLRQRGVTLVELVLFMVIVGVGVAGLVSVTGSLVRSSPDPMLRKQMLATAESLLNEVLQQPFTWCDPTDENAARATKAELDTTKSDPAKCWNVIEDLGPETGESRYGEPPGRAFNNVNDYHGFSEADIGDVTGNHRMHGYTASVAVERAGTAFGLADNTAALSVSVTVQRAGQDDIRLTGYRFRYAPRI